MNKENCALKLVDEIILYYDARSKKHQTNGSVLKKKRPRPASVRTPANMEPVKTCVEEL